MPVVPYPGMAFRHGGHGDHHLYVVLNAPCPDGSCLVAMLRSVKKDRFRDTACILNIGDHRFIRHATWIEYRALQCPRAAHVTNMIDKRYYDYDPDDDFDPGVLADIIDGIEASDHTPDAMRAYAKRWCA